VGCLSDNRTEELQCMKTISADVLGRAISNKTLNAIGSPHGGWPMVDNVTVLTNEEYARRGEVGEFAQVVRLTTRRQRRCAALSKAKLT
jgi:hypothetical protein